MAHYLWYSAKHRSLTFFSAANPAIPFGGMLDESKEAIDRIIPPQYRPTTVLYDPSMSLTAQLTAAHLNYPIIIKPDIGLKGHHVYNIKNSTEAQGLIGTLDMGRRWLLQEYIDYEREYALLVARWPDSDKIEILSLIEKKYPTVVGDGISTLKDLILEHPHPYLCKPTVLKRWEAKSASIPESGTSIIIDNIGNYSRGATFHSLMDCISADFCKECSNYLQGFNQLYFYRMDLKADDQRALASGHFKIVEVNGTKSEPLHIYDKRHTFWQNARHIKRHWQIMSEISRFNTDKGFELPSFSDGIAAVKSVKQMLAT